MIQKPAKRNSKISLRRTLATKRIEVTWEVYIKMFTDKLIPAAR